MRGNWVKFARARMLWSPVRLVVIFVKEFSLKCNAVQSLLLYTVISGNVGAGRYTLSSEFSHAAW